MFNKESTPGAASRPAGGFTLIELLVVSSIMAVMLGIAAGSLSRLSRGSALDSAERLVRAALVRSRMEARTLGALSQVLLLPADPLLGTSVRLRAAHAVRAGSWHFDDQAGGRGALGGGNRYARLGGAREVPGGWLGHCLELKNGSLAVVDPDPELDPSHGFDLSLYFKMRGLAGAGTLCSFGESFSLLLADDGSVTGRVTARKGDQERILKTRKGIFEPGVWTRVGFSFDGLELALRVHHAVEARARLKDVLLAPGAQARLRLGGSGFEGRIDEVAYLTMIFDEDQELDAGVELMAKKPILARFDGRGRLDSRVHEGPVAILLSLEGEQTRVLIDKAGVIR